MSNQGLPQAANWRWDQYNERWVKDTGARDEAGRVVTTDDYFAIRVAEDSGDSNVTYVGKAEVGSAVGSGVWQIRKIDETSGTEITWAGGNDNFSFKWSNREALSYS